MGKKEAGLLFARPFEVFLAVASQKSYTLAAKTLGVTQSAVSQQIAILQKQLGFDLFVQGVRPLQLTPEAIILRSEIQAQRSSLEQTITSLQKRNLYKPVLKIGAVESMIFNLSAFFFKDILKNFSKVHLQSGVTNDLLDKLIMGRVDVVVASDHTLAEDKFLKVFVFSEPYILLLPKEIGRKRNYWTWESMRLIGLPFAHYTANTSTSHQTEAFFYENMGIVPSRIEVDSNRLVFSLVESGMACGVCQPSALLAEGEDMFERLAIFPMPSPLSCRSIYAYARSDYPLPWLYKVRDVFVRGIQEIVLPKLQKCLANHPEILVGLATFGDVKQENTEKGSKLQ
ncbi:MAG TPA: LysR family transcriptional regulator [Candidatus Aphodousia gallistercoris]|nr:LysR family transcriptional regulator [Candidatus Aphodousia gallistercoris]